MSSEQTLSNPATTRPAHLLCSRMTVQIASALLIFTTMSSSYAQTAAPNTPAVTGSDFSTYTPATTNPLTNNLQSNEATVRMTMRDADIKAVIEWIAEQTGKQIVVDPRVTGTMTVLADQPMTVSQAYEVFLSALNIYGLSAVEQNGILRILPADNAKSQPQDVVSEFAKLEGGNQVVHIVSMSNVSATQAAEVVKPLLSQGGLISPINTGNSLLVADTADNTKRIVQLLRMLDKNADLDVDIIRLKHASAPDVTKVVSSLIASSGEQASQNVVAADERSNAVMISGQPGIRKRIRQIINDMDQPLATTSMTRVVYVNYQDASELQTVLKAMIPSLVGNDSKELVNVETSKASNALVLSGNRSALDRLENVIKKLDKRRAQVLVEAVIVELSQDFVEKLGVEWQTDLSGDGTQAISNFGIANAIEGNDGPLEQLIGRGLSVGYYRNGSLRALVRAFAQDTNNNVLSTPSVITLDNQEAEILVGSNIPLITGQATGEASSTDNPFTTFERKDIGVSLKVTPKINDDKAITLSIEQNVETVSPASATANDIVTNKRSITTNVIVDDASMLVLGGLISTEEQVVVDKVPVLGDMPLVGGLFRSTSNTRTKKNLMVFINPRIIDNREKADQETGERYEQMQEIQQDYNEDNVESEEGLPLLPDFETYSPKQVPHLQEPEKTSQ